MRINTIRLTSLHNDEHFRFHTEFRDLVIATDAEALKIETQFDNYLALYTQVDEALMKIQRSALADEIRAADRRRDNTFCGMTETARAALNHFRPETAEAARRLQVLFNTCDNLARRPLNEQTSALYNLLQELNDAYILDVNVVGILDWMQELEANNRTFDELVKTRYDEKAQRADAVLRNAQLEIDSAYLAITERLEALVIVEGTENGETFIHRFNAVVAKYNDILAQRIGQD